MKHETRVEPHAHTRKFEILSLDEWHPYGWIILLGFIVYGRTIFFDYTYYIDDSLILTNFESISNPANVFRAFLEPTFTIYYRPIATISFIVDAQWSGTSPGGYHLTNIICHILTACLVFRLMRALKYNRPLSFLCSALITLHPLTTQTVAWIPGRNESLLAIFVLSAFIYLIKFVETRDMRHYFLHIVLFVLALFTKETALAVPPLCLLYLHLVAREKLYSRATISLLMGWSIGGLLWFLLRTNALAGAVAAEQYVLAGNILRNLPTLLELAGKFVVPVQLSPLSFFNSLSVGIGICVVLTVALTIALRRNLRSPMTLFGTLWFIIFMLPGLTVFIKPTDYLEYRVYLSLVGATIVLAEFVRLGSPALEKKLHRVFTFIVLVFSTITFIYEGSCVNDVRFWSYVVEHSPPNDELYYNLGMAYDRDDAYIDNAEATYRRAISLNPKKIDYHHNLGVIYAKKGMAKEAEEKFRSALALDPTNAHVHYNLGSLNYLRGNYGQAESLWKKAIALAPTLPDPYAKLISLLQMQKRYSEAFQYVEMIKRHNVRIDPTLLRSLEPNRK